MLNLPTAACAYCLTCLHNCPRIQWVRNNCHQIIYRRKHRNKPIIKPKTEWLALRKRPKICHGYTLIELLLALLLVSIGFLGVLSVQSHSVQSSLAIARQVSALQLIDEICQRILVNSNAARNGDYRYAGGAAGVALGSCSTASEAHCDARAIARDDIDEWAYRLQTLLPGSDGFIEYRDAEQLTVTLIWPSQSSATGTESGTELCHGEHYAGFRCISASIHL